MRTVSDQGIGTSLDAARKAAAESNYAAALTALGDVEPGPDHTPAIRSRFYGVRGLCRMMVDAHFSEAILDFCTVLTIATSADDMFASAVRYNLGLALLLANEPASGSKPSDTQRAGIEDALVYLTTSATLLAEKAKSDRHAALWSGLAYSLTAEALLALGRTAKKKDEISRAASSSEWMFVYYGEDDQNEVLTRRLAFNAAVAKTLAPKPRRSKTTELPPQLPHVRLNEASNYATCP